jgi:Domain of unknown function (DUF1918)
MLDAEGSSKVRWSMHLEVGDRLLVTEHDGRSTSHVCRILSSEGPEGTPPYLVLRYDTGEEEVLAPDSDLDIRILTHTPA